MCIVLEDKVMGNHVSAGNLCQEIGRSFRPLWSQTLNKAQRQ